MSPLASGGPVPTSRVPMSGPDLAAAELDAVTAVLRSGCLSIGPALTAFEQQAAAITGAGQAVGVSSGTAGLHLAVLAAGVQPGDLVITTPFSFIASANCVLYERAIPVFVDVDPVTGNIDPRQVAAAAADLTAGGDAARRWLPRGLRETPPTGTLKAIVAVHAFGQPADMDPLVATARRHGLWVIEDACEAVGAEYKGRAAGTLGDVGVFAFYPNKQVTTGEGGMLLTDRPDWARLFRSLRNQGRDEMSAWLEHDRLGYNYRLDEMSAALGAVQFARLHELLACRNRVSAWYDARLAGMDGVTRPTVAPHVTRMCWFAYAVRLAADVPRDLVMADLEASGVPSRPYFAPIHLQPFYASRFGYRRGDFPVAEALGDSCLALPFSGTTTSADVDRVCAALAASIGRRRRRRLRATAMPQAALHTEAR